MTKDAYKYLSIALAVVVIGLLVYIFTRPKQIDTATFAADLSAFSAQLQQWNATYGQNPTPAANQELSGDLSAFTQKLQNYQ